MKTFLTERRAWEKIRDAFDHYEEARRLSRNGLCYAINLLWECEEISGTTCSKMEEAVRNVELPDDDLCYYWPKNADGAKARVVWITNLLDSRPEIV